MTFEGNLQAEIYKFTFAYMADGGPLVFMKSIAIVVSEQLKLIAINQHFNK